MKNKHVALSLRSHSNSVFSYIKKKAKREGGREGGLTFFRKIGC